MADSKNTNDLKYKQNHEDEASLEITGPLWVVEVAHRGKKHRGGGKRDLKDSKFYPDVDSKIYITSKAVADVYKDKMKNFNPNKHRRRILSVKEVKK